ncbi:MAG: metallophosphoesterase [Bacilli bacterium]|nr:metallophosphoesterase [Bacilli bacterium]
MKRFLIADLHFGHENVIKYTSRPFVNAEEMNQRLIEFWNSVVGNDDLVYVLGDFTLSRKMNVIKNLVNLLNGKKILIMGNHDTRKPKDYVECGFEVATKKPIMVEPGAILMHEPFENSSLIASNYIYFFGHVHANKTLMDEYPNCMCVSVERIDYKPINLDECIKKKLRKRRWKE